MNPFEAIKKGVANIFNTGTANSTSATAFPIAPASDLLKKPAVKQPTPSIFTTKTPQQQVQEVNLGIKSGQYNQPTPKKVEYSNPIPLILGGKIEKPTGKEVVASKPKEFMNDLFGNAKKIVAGDPFERAESRRIEKDFGISPNIFESIRKEGLLPSVGKTDSEKVSERYEALFEAGIDSKRAEQIAYADVFNRNNTANPKESLENQAKYDALNITDKEKKAMRWTKVKEIGGLALDVVGNVPMTFGSLKFLKPFAKTIAETNDLKIITSELVESGMPQNIADRVAKDFVNITDEVKVAKKISDIAENAKANPSAYGEKTVKTYPDIVSQIAKEKDPAKIKVLLEQTGVDKTQYDTMAKVLSATDNPRRTQNVIEGFTKLPEKKVGTPFLEPKFEEYGIYNVVEQKDKYDEFLKPQLDKIKNLKDDEVVVYYNGSGKGDQYVNTNLKEVFTYPVDKNSVVKKVKKSDLISTGDAGKDEIGYRMLKQTEPTPVKLSPTATKKVEEIREKINELDQKEFETGFMHERQKELIDQLEERYENVDIGKFKRQDYNGADFGGGASKIQKYDKFGRKLKIKTAFNKVANSLEDLTGTSRDGKTIDEVAEEVRDLIDKKAEWRAENKRVQEDLRQVASEKKALLKQIAEVEKSEKLAQTSKLVEEKFFQKQAEKTAKLVEEEKLAKIKAEQRILRQEEVSKQLEETQKRLLDEQAYKIRQKELIAQARRPDITNDSLGGRIRRAFRKTLFPIKNVDEKTQEIFRDWKRKLIVSKALAEEQFAKLAIPKEQGMKIINDFQAGRKTEFTEQIKKIFDGLFKEAKEKGFDFRYRENYLPQVYKETPEEIRQKMEEYLASKGLGDKLIQDYLDGVVELPEDISRTLKLNPSFEKERTFPTYEVAKQYGLTPKYESPAQLAAHYKEQMEIAFANKKFIQKLAEEGKVLKEADAPKSWNEIKLKLEGDRYFAKPDFAEIINGQLTEAKDLGLFGNAVKGLAKTSKAMQEIALSAGVPKSTFNFFAIGQAIKSMTAGDIKMAVEVMTRANLNSASIKFFTENADVIKQMANQGLDLGDRVGTYKKVYESIGDKLNRKEYREAIGESFSKLFNEKTFASFMPQMQISNFKQIYAKAIKDGMPPAEAEKFAGDVTKKFFGLFEDVGRSNSTNDGLTALFFAPRFREGMINVLMNTAKSVTTELKNPVFYKNRRLAYGMALTYAAYNMLNKQINGNYMWENEPGKEFALKIPYGNGQFVYVEFMPSFLAFARSLISGGYNLATGNTKVATQKLGSIFSMPIKTATDVVSNSDYFDRPIYKDSDTGGQKALKIADYSVSSFNHPYFKELRKQLQDDNKTPLLQSISIAMELPLKYSNQTKINQAKYFDNLEKFNKENTRIKESNQKAMQPTFDKVQKLKEEGKMEEAKAIVDALENSEYDTYKTMLTAQKSKTTSQNKMNLVPIFEKVQELKAQGKMDEAGEIIDSLTDEEYKNYTALKKSFTMKEKISVSTE